MKLEARHKKIALGVGVGVLGAAVIGGTLGLISNRNGMVSSRRGENPGEEVVIEGTATFDGSLVAESAKLTDLPSAAEPVIVSSTEAPQRLTAISSGRQDPFSLPFIPAVPRASTTQTPTNQQNDSASANNPGSGQSISLIPLPAPPVLPTPVLPTLPTAAQGSVVAVAPTSQAPAVPTTGTISVPQAPPTPQASLIDAIQVTGVVQLGDRVNAIVQVPNEGSRYAQVGERIASGQVLVKQINVADGQEPLVVLEYNGREYSKIVGGTSLAGLM